MGIEKSGETHERKCREERSAPGQEAHRPPQASTGHEELGQARAAAAPSPITEIKDAEEKECQFDENDSANPGHASSTFQ